MIFLVGEKFFVENMRMHLENNPSCAKMCSKVSTVWILHADSNNVRCCIFLT